jgi:hypothetical protein
MFGKNKKEQIASSNIEEEQSKRDELEAELQKVRHMAEEAEEERLGQEKIIKNFELYGNSLLLVQQSLAKLNTSLTDQRHDLDLQPQETEEGNRESMSKMSRNLSQVLEGVSYAKGSIENLNGNTKKIINFVTVVNEIATQTNLLSLNAAIEAAKSGAAGKGFAVVAEEVRKLSDRTAIATKEISAIVDAILEGSDQVMTRIVELDAYASETQGLNNSLVGNFQKTAQLATLGSKIIWDAAYKNFIELAKFDHLVFKFEIYRFILGLSKKTVDDFASHTKCRLGKWYYEGEGREYFSKHPGYRMLEKPHMEVHDFARKALSRYVANDTAECAELLSSMEYASTAVIDTLEQLAVQ